MCEKFFYQCLFIDYNCILIGDPLFRWPDCSHLLCKQITIKNMAPFAIACIVALLIFIFAILQLRKFHILHKLAKTASCEYKLILQSIKLIETIGEYCFWQNEVKSFIKNYKGKINDHLYITYSVLLNTALRQRFEKGFHKAHTT